MGTIDLSTRGKYQPVADYEMVSGGNTGYPRPADNAPSYRAVVESALTTAGFVRTAQPGGNWVHLEAQLQARVCVSCSGQAPAGETIHGTIGVELWDEPNADQLV